MSNSPHIAGVRGPVSACRRSGNACEHQVTRFGPEVVGRFMLGHTSAMLTHDPALQMHHVGQVVRMCHRANSKPQHSALKSELQAMRRAILHGLGECLNDFFTRGARDDFKKHLQSFLHCEQGDDMRPNSSLML